MTTVGLRESRQHASVAGGDGTVFRTEFSSSSDRGGSGRTHSVRLSTRNAGDLVGVEELVDVVAV